MAQAATAIVERPETPPAEPESSGSLREFIQRASLDSTFDVGKLERLVALYERQKADEAKAAYFDSMRALKLELPIIERNGRIVIHEKGKEKIDANIIQNTAFARWEDIDAAITPVLDKHGFSLTFRTGVAPDGKVTVTGIATHKLGHSEETTIALPHDSSGSKNPVQAVGSALSYGKRYAATMLLNIRTKGEDDDGQAAGADDPIDEDQRAHINDLLGLTKSDPELFCKFMGVDALTEIKRKDYEKAIVALNTKGKKLQTKAAAQ